LSNLIRLFSSLAHVYFWNSVGSFVSIQSKEYFYMEMQTQ